INVDRIIDGVDVRTTIMMRNIPTTMTSEGLKRLLDETSPGRFDFSYLRVDFSTGINVGYAFVNFISANDVAAFALTWENRRWVPTATHYSSLAYATIQGLDALIDKFRNSAVMTEASAFRPKLWYTEENAPTANLVGHEMPFPGPNNAMQHRRSIEQAQRVGL
ncbi:hypothetical protein K470DRAFT_206429, partial [Piedraia hortae CBS 480.64]